MFDFPFFCFLLYTPYAYRVHHLLICLSRKKKKIIPRLPYFLLVYLLLALIWFKYLLLARLCWEDLLIQNRFPNLYMGFRHKDSPPYYSRPFFNFHFLKLQLLSPLILTTKSIIFFTMSFSFHVPCHSYPIIEHGC